MSSVVSIVMVAAILAFRHAQETAGRRSASRRGTSG
jgi:hypothetical protein